MKRGFLVALLLASFLLPPSSYAAESPLYIPFQGQVTNQIGTNVQDGQYTVIFNLYSQAVGGQPVWSERHVKIGVTRGMINVFLGSIAPLAGVDFSQTKYLGITVDTDNLATTADPEMVPRSLIMPAFHAKDSEKLAGQNWSAIIVDGSNSATNDPVRGFLSGAKVAAGSITGTKIEDGTITAADLSASLQADSIVPAGTVVAFAGTAPPAGWLLCDGTVASRTTRDRLFAAIGTAHGNGDGTTTFNLPDYRGMFLRGVSGPSSNDPDKTSRTAMASGGNVGNTVGSTQEDELVSHQHGGRIFSVAVPGPNAPVGGPGPFQISNTTDAAGGSETRPINAYVNYIIKY